MLYDKHNNKPFLCMNLFCGLSPSNFRLMERDSPKNYPAAVGSQLSFEQATQAYANYRSDSLHSFFSQNQNTKPVLL